MPPKQFWKLAPIEWWWQADARRPKQEVTAIGLTLDEVAELYDSIMK